MEALMDGALGGEGIFQGCGTSALSRLDFWVEPQALAAFLVAIDHIAASACGSAKPQFLTWTEH